MGRYSKNSRNIRTLNTVQQLKDATFGHRFPRHGLKLLHWLANDMIKFDNIWTILCHPDNRGFGFHIFHNSEGILPPLTGSSRYFEVGNLHAPGAQSLPFREDQSWNMESNTDRIILRLDSNMMIGSVYITEHTPNNSRFSAKDTYRLSNKLIRSIKGESLENFLRKAGYDPGESVQNHRASNESYSITIEEESSDTSSHNEDNETYGLLDEHSKSSNRRTFTGKADPRDDSNCCCIIL
uniref:Uncharacterized protein n=1 Tax=Anguilla anguilla TaxID=7936 RepID=A0A0E9XGV5_ANGAN